MTDKQSDCPICYAAARYGWEDHTHGKGKDRYPAIQTAPRWAERKELVASGHLESTYGESELIAGARRRGIRCT